MIRILQASDKDKEVLDSLPRDPFIELNDDFDYSQVIIEKPWGHEYSIYKNRDIDVWFLFLKPGHKTSMHCHPHKKSSLTILAGEARVSTLTEQVVVRAGDSFLIDKGVFHSTEALSPQGIYLLESETPINKKNLVRFDDLYGRAGKRYESGRHVQSRDETTAPSFYGSSHGAVKQLGFSDIRLQKMDRGTPLASISPAAVGILLSGLLHDAEGVTIFSCGDVFSGEFLAKHGIVAPRSEIEVLLIECPERSS